MRIPGRSLAVIAAFLLAPRGVLLSEIARPAPLHGIVLHAHNCFPEDGRWVDRLDRALGTGVRPIAIEQDLGWYMDPATGKGRVVLTHGGELTGREPSLEDYFFSRVRPIIERALAENHRESWPQVFLHFNIRNNDPVQLQAIWDLLGQYEPWLTTAARGSDESALMPFSVGPLMVLTESGQEEVFYRRVPVGERLRVFGTLLAGRQQPTASNVDRQTPDQTPAEVLIPSRATNYRRWINFPWSVVERGGQPAAADWTMEDDARLRALVARAHDMGLWIRFYTLNGHASAENQGWSAGYNFGSLDAARERWKAAVDAGVDFLATDQYELLGDFLRTRTAN